jgi:hypothetical protein
MYFLNRISGIVAGCCHYMTDSVRNLYTKRGWKHIRNIVTVAVETLGNGNNNDKTRGLKV